MRSKLSVTVYLFLALHGSTIIGHTTVPFFPVVIFSGCNLNPPKNMDFNGRPDDCTFFFRVVIFSGCNLSPPKNMAEQTSVPFFLVVIFPVVCKYHSWCLCQNTKPIKTRKNYDRTKKGTVLWPAMFFEPPEKITARKKKVQSSDRRLKCQNTNTSNHTLI